MTILQDEATSRDIVQELFIHLFEKSDDLNIRSDIKYYLISGCRNRCLNYIRSGKIRLGHTQAAGHRGSNHVNSEENLELQDLHNEIQSLIDQLPDRCAQIFRMNRFEGKRNAEIANELNLSIRTVESQISRAIRYLRANLTHQLSWWILIILNNL